jgi:hypothetical protein
MAGRQEGERIPCPPKFQQRRMILHLQILFIPAFHCAICVLYRGDSARFHGLAGVCCQPVISISHHDFNYQLNLSTV